MLMGLLSIKRNSVVSILLREKHSIGMCHVLAIVQHKHSLTPHRTHQVYPHLPLGPNSRNEAKSSTDNRQL